MTINLSVAVITRNEEKYIKNFIKQFDFVDEIILVDSFSTDKTIKIAYQNKKVKIFQRVFDDFTNQKNFALNLCKNDWVLFFDADERINEHFKHELYNALKSTKHTGFKVRRKFYIKNKLVRFSGFQNDFAIRVINKNYCQYSSNFLVHEQIKSAGKIGKFSSTIDHYFFSDIENFKKKLRLYSKYKSKELLLKNIKPNFFHFKIKPIFRFLHHYIFKLGILDGNFGLLISKLFKNHVHERYIFLKEYYQKKNNKDKI